MLEGQGFALKTIDIRSHIIIPIPEVHLLTHRTWHNVKVSLAGTTSDFLAEIKGS